MLEEIVFLETEKALGSNYKVYKLQFHAEDFDMVVYDTAANSCTVCEIRGNAAGNSGNAYRRLPDAERRRQIERRFGVIKEHFILSREPESRRENGRLYCRVEDYLKSLNDITGEGGIRDE